MEVRTHDTLGRKLRNVPQKERGYDVVLTPRDLIWFYFMYCHGGRATTSYLHKLTEHIHRDRCSTTDRLTQLARAGYLSRPAKQFHTIDPRWNELVHELTDKALEVLKQEDKLSPYAPTMRGDHKHQVFSGCVSEAFEYWAQKEAVPFKSQIQILAEAGWPEPRRQKHPVFKNLFENPLKMELDGRAYTPDGINYLETDKGYLNFFEIDRATEGHDAYFPKIRAARFLIGGKLYKEMFKVDCRARFVFITTTEARRQKFLRYVKEEFTSPTNPEGKCDYIITYVIPAFGQIFHPPKEIFNLLNVEWERSGYKPFKYIS